MTKTSERALLVANTSWDGGLDDGSVFKGVYGLTRVWSDHPAARKWPAYFTELEATHETPVRAPKVEAATAAPGERR